MRVKLNRGPMKNKYVHIQDGTYDFIVEAPLEIDWRKVSVYDHPPRPMTRRGSYHRSNTTLKNGAVVFEWMGWKE